MKSKKEILKEFEELKKRVIEELKNNTREAIRSTFVKNNYLLYNIGTINLENKSEVPARITGLLSDNGGKFLDELVENIYKVYIEEY